MRFGLGVSVALGGLISMGILVVGTAVTGTFSFAGLATTLTQELGPWAGKLFAVGLFAAGLSSAITAPLAAAITTRGLFGHDDARRWQAHSWRYRSIWIAVLVVGMSFGLAGVRPVPAIVAAQAANGILLPLLAVFLIVAVNDRGLMGTAVNGRISNLAMSCATAVCFLLGSVRTLGALAAALGVEAPSQQILVLVATGALVVTAVPVSKLVVSRRRGAPGPD
jgi:Mn2+/Fe2+ NRAMP family transporter